MREVVKVAAGRAAAVRVRAAKGAAGKVAVRAAVAKARAEPKVALRAGEARGVGVAKEAAERYMPGSLTVGASAATPPLASASGAAWTYSR